MSPSFSLSCTRVVLFSALRARSTINLSVVNMIFIFDFGEENPCPTENHGPSHQTVHNIGVRPE